MEQSPVLKRANGGIKLGIRELCLPSNGSGRAESMMQLSWNTLIRPSDAMIQLPKCIWGSSRGQLLEKLPPGRPSYGRHSLIS